MKRWNVLAMISPVSAQRIATIRLTITLPKPAFVIPTP